MKTETIDRAVRDCRTVEVPSHLTSKEEVRKYIEPEVRRGIEERGGTFLFTLEIYEIRDGYPNNSVTFSASAYNF